jgi:transposase
MLCGGDLKEVLKIIKRSSDARVIYRANALNLRRKGLTMVEVADFLEISVRTVFNIEQNYEEGGLEKALYDDPRPGQPVVFDDRVKAQIVATVCSEPPEGFDRWSLVLLQEYAKKSGAVSSISHESIRIILQEHDIKPWRQKMWCVPELTEEFIARMEDVLEVYERKVDLKKPLICLDEKPIQLLENIRPPSGLLPGKEKRIDFEYQRNGTCSVFCAVEPHKGKYINRVTERRTSADFAKFLSSVERQYSEASKIILVMDNLNTHRLKSLVDFYGEEEGSRIWNRFEVHFTPKHGSWLNQAEIAINLYARQCLGKARIPSIELLRKKTAAWNKITNRKKVPIKWKFTRKLAQEKFKYNRQELS